MLPVERWEIKSGDSQNDWSMACWRTSLIPFPFSSKLERLLIAMTLKLMTVYLMYPLCRDQIPYFTDSYDNKQVCKVLRSIHKFPQATLWINFCFTVWLLILRLPCLENQFKTFLLVLVGLSWSSPGLLAWPVKRYPKPLKNQPTNQLDQAGRPKKTRQPSRAGLRIFRI